VVLYYFDSSALVKRYISERGTAWVLGITDPGAGNIIFVARITAVEVVSAITRAAWAGSITSADAFSAKANFRYDYLNQYRAMEITAGLIARAMALAEQYALRGYDAVQLAAAVEVQAYNLSVGLPVLTLISADAALNTATTAEGLAVDDPNNHPS
jgi:predicted nucleic acid-binding protein